MTALAALTPWHYVGAATVALVLALAGAALLTAHRWASHDPTRGDRRDRRARNARRDD